MKNKMTEWNDITASPEIDVESFFGKEYLKLFL